ncbi:MAG: CRTAC1 family protein [Actinomycetota bacterium]
MNVYASTVCCILAGSLLTGCGKPLGPATPAAAKQPDQGIYADATGPAGVQFEHRSGMVKALHPNLLQTTGSGCALFDYDQDGRLDLYLIDGNHQPGGGNRLYRNQGDGRFQDVTDTAGARGHGYGMGCATADYDGDGDVDLYVTNYGPNILYRNNGDGSFTDVTRSAGVALPQWSTAAAFLDVDGDRDLDLYVGQYVKFSEKSRQLCETMGVMGGCNPSEYVSESDVLFINDGNGRFHDGTANAGIVDVNGRALAVLADDYDDDGRPDLFVANDGSANFLFHNEGGGRFKDAGIGAGVAFGLGGRAEASMGSDWGDYDGDGRRDLAIGNFEGETDALYRNLGSGIFQYATAEAGLAIATIPVLTFGLGFLDFDNDGDLDLAQANGHVHPLIETVDPDAPYKQSRQLFENVGKGRFRDITASAGPGYTTLAVGRGLAFGDIDNDGDIDMLANNNGMPAHLLRSELKSKSHWMGVQLGRTGCDVRGLGARVTVETAGKKAVRYARTAYSFASANDPRVHFGLGSEAGPVTITVDWPDGKKSQVKSAAVDRYMTIP